MNIIQTILVAATLSLSCGSEAAILLNVGTTYTQNFDAMGTSQTLPVDWQVTFNNTFTNPSQNPYLDSSSSLAYQASGGTPTTPGTYNFGSAGGLDRAVGAIPFSTFSSATTLSSLLLAHFYINDPAITSLRISYVIETYFIGELPMPTILGLYSSSQVATNWNWLAADIGSGSVMGHNFTTPPSKTVNTVLTSAKFTTGDLYLIYQFNGDGANGLALDNLSITAIPEPCSAIFLMSASMIACRRKRSNNSLLPTATNPTTQSTSFPAALRQSEASRDI